MIRHQQRQRDEPIATFISELHRLKKLVRRVAMTELVFATWHRADRNEPHSLVRYPARNIMREFFSYAMLRRARRSRPTRVSFHQSRNFFPVSSMKTSSSVGRRR